MAYTSATVWLEDFADPHCFPRGMNFNLWWDAQCTLPCCSTGMANEHARGAVAAAAARAPHHDLGHHAGAVLHRLRLPRLLYSPAVSCFPGTPNVLIT